MIADTSFLIDLARGDEGARGLVAQAQHSDLLLLPSIVVAEYLAGSRDPKADLETLAQAGEIVPFGVADAASAGMLAREALAAGRFPGWADIFIAATAHARSLPLLTRNARHMEGVQVQGY